MCVENESEWNLELRSPEASEMKEQDRKIK